ncbi:DEAD/DEAH box helicase [Allonocardiopsis opalescens]|uniref:Helicase-like protein n=1 Tax=Allonocardiopsis opalescens TaxID=1144618 RepID=A0A2T0Q4Y7_9ACTN|nr:DEAD/DEAH box helicase [Allonocardiopsis opalescens]PRX98771.1 helicase-like protein [Allonocardiopsis opalescens]
MDAVAGAAGRLVRCGVVFEPGDPARCGRVVFYRADEGVAVPSGVGEPGEVVVALPESGGVVVRSVPAVRLGVADALGVLCRAREGAGSGAHPSAVFWGAVVVEALALVGRGRVLPGVSAGGFDAWRVGPVDGRAGEALGALVAAMPASARAVPLPGGGVRLADGRGLVREFVDAVADGVVRTAAAPAAVGFAAFAAVEPVGVEGLREWAAEAAAGVDAGVRVSLRVECVEGAGGEGPPPLRAVVQVHDLADASRVADAAALWAGSAPGFGAGAPMEAAVAVRRAARVWPVLEGLLGRAVPDAVALGDEEVAELLGSAGERLAAAGVAVHWPRELVADLAARVVVGGDEVRARGGGGVLGGGPVALDWRLALGGELLSEAEMAALAAEHRPVVRLRGRWVLLAPGLGERLRDRGLEPVAPVRALGAVLSGAAVVDGRAVEVVARGWAARLAERVAAGEGGSEPVGEPPGLAGRLRDYQLRGLRWLVRMTGLGLGGCLADDMGLGKTVTVIALHLHRAADRELRGAGPTLVVCPASVLGNWEREVRRFAPGVAVRRFHGAGRSLEGADGGFVLTTYATMRADAGVLAGRRWGLVVADEAQLVKNPWSGTAAALRRVPSAARVALTGTPVENELADLWAVLDWTTPGLLGSLGEFRERWRAVEEDRDAQAAARLARLVGPFVLRRRKSDPGIAPELPAKTVTDRPVGLTREQAGLYEAVVAEALERIAAAEGMARRGLVMGLLTACKQICNHPAQFLKEADPVLAGRSGKLERLEGLVDTVVAEGGAVLVFTQYVAMGRLLVRRLAERGAGVLLLHGGTPVAEREAMVARFQAGEVPVFVLSLRAAGTGLNLTRADHVVHYDRWWNPAVEEQATDRAYRIGQTRPVQVHRLVAEGTVEERIAALLESKRELAEAVLAAGDEGAALTELSDGELAELVALREVR